MVKIQEKFKDMVLLDLNCFNVCGFLFGPWNPLCPFSVKSFLLMKWNEERWRIYLIF